jgi:hypothetical protein
MVWWSRCRENRDLFFFGLEGGGWKKEVILKEKYLPLCFFCSAVKYIAFKMVIAKVLQTAALVGMSFEGMLGNGDNWKMAVMGFEGSSFKIYYVEKKKEWSRAFLKGKKFLFTNSWFLSVRLSERWLWMPLRLIIAGKASEIGSGSPMCNRALLMDGCSNHAGDAQLGWCNASWRERYRMDGVSDIG